MTPYLSVIIPAHNEAERITKTLRAVHTFLRTKDYAWQIIVVDDGSTDLTASIVHNAAAIIPNLSLLQLTSNLGKGAAVKAEMLHAKGDARLFTGADNSTSVAQVDKLLPFLQEGYDVVVGSRRIDGAIIHKEQSPLRELLGACFRVLVHMLVPLAIKDTQNGFKLFSARAANVLFKRLRTSGWAFDVEILKWSTSLGLRIREVPVEWTNDKRSRLRFTHMLRMLEELCVIAALSSQLPAY